MEERKRYILRLRQLIARATADRFTSDEPHNLTAGDVAECLTILTEEKECGRFKPRESAAD